jgi:hypothetical protein
VLQEQCLLQLQLVVDRLLEPEQCLLQLLLTLDPL